jgi:histidinol-phosphate phosphatase family protein
MNKAVFLDRDGIINKNPAEHDYVKSWNEFILLEGIVDALKLFQRLGYLTVVITNQAGISKGLMSEDTLLDIHNKLDKLLSGSGSKVDHFYYCPHKDQDNCGCRKPKSGMIRKAVKDLDIDLDSSILIGDSDTDLKLGKNTGIKTVIVKTDSNLFESIMNKNYKCYYGQKIIRKETI